MGQTQNERAILPSRQVDKRSWDYGTGHGWIDREEGPFIFIFFLFIHSPKRDGEREKEENTNAVAVAYDDTNYELWGKIRAQGFVFFLIERIVFFFLFLTFDNASFFSFCFSWSTLPNIADVVWNCWAVWLGRAVGIDVNVVIQRGFFFLYTSAHAYVCHRLSTMQQGEWLWEWKKKRGKRQERKGWQCGRQETDKLTNQQTRPLVYTHPYSHEWR